MSPTLFEALDRMLTEFEALSETARATRLDRIGARADLAEVTAEVVELVKALDGINRWRFGKEPELLVEWRAARRVVVSGGKRVAQVPGAVGVIPPADGGVAPAA